MVLKVSCSDSCTCVQCYNSLEFMDFYILNHLNFFNSKNKQFVSVYLGRLTVLNIPTITTI